MTVIAQCLDSLYEYSPKFRVSIDLIQRLAQNLRLETFVDTLGYTVESSKKEDTQRLSIAGSFILIDVDFKEDSIIAVSMSSPEDQTAREQGDYVKSQTTTGDVNKVVLDVTKSPLSFLKQSTAEVILLENLQQDRLNNFPLNLKYLANIDQLSTSSSNLFLYLEKVALLLYEISVIEGVEKLEDWLISLGYTSSIGKISMNDAVHGQVGLFSTFWKDSRFINHESSSLYGNEYRLLLGIDPAENATKVDYLTQNKDTVWELNGQKYTFDFDSTPEISSNWTLNITINHPVYVPKFLVEYLGLKHTVANTESEYEELLAKLATEDEVTHDIDGLPFSLQHEIAYSEFIPLKSAAINAITDLPQVISILRNFIVLANIYNNIIGEWSEPHRNRSRRGSKAVNPELTEESRQKLKESLKLSYDVTDEELLGLNTLADTSFTGIQPSKRDDVDLEAFLKEEKTTKPFLRLRFIDIDLTSKHKDLILSLEGVANVTFRISNGIIEQLQGGDAMEIEDSRELRLVKGLSLTEDLVLSYKHVYI